MADDTFDWSQLPGYGTDPAAGMSDWSNVQGGYDTASPGLATSLSPDELNFPSMIDPGLKTSLDTSELNPTQGAATGGSVVAKILQALKGNGSPTSGLSGLGSALGAFSSGEKANRYMQGSLSQGYDKLMLDAQAARNATETDAMRKLGATSYIQQGGSNFKPPTLAINGRNIQTPNLGYGPRPSSDAEKAGAAALQSQLQARLSPGGTYTPQPLSGYATPGTAEQIGSLGAAGVSGLGSIFNAFSGGGGQPMSQPIPGQPGKFATSPDGGKTWIEQ